MCANCSTGNFYVEKLQMTRRDGGFNDQFIELSYRVASHRRNNTFIILLLFILDEIFQKILRFDSKNISVCPFLHLSVRPFQ